MPHAHYKSGTAFPCNNRLLRSCIAIEDSDDSDEERSLNDVIKSLQTSRMFSKWVKQGVSADEAYKLLKIGDVSDNVLGSTRFASLVKYVDEFNAKNSGSRMSIYNTLNKKFGLQRTAQMIYEALAQPNTRRLGERLQAEQLHSWLGSGSSQEYAAHALLDIKPAENIFRQRGWNAWVAYVRNYNKLYPDNEILASSVLRHVYKDGNVVKMLENALSDPVSKRRAHWIQTEYIQTLQQERNSADDIFKMFSLNKCLRIGTFKHQHFDQYCHMDESNAKNLGSRMSIYNTLNKKLGLQRTAQMIYEALAQPNTRRLGERLQVEQLHSWMKNGILVDEAYKLLKLEACRTTSLKVDTFGFLVKYVDEFDS
ncbi:unnamed protein product [Phytophthora lilii]|uniref:Unnamed protein product n=1 Tax=Phytophthora lilii TaxID=2077276 RepID=A0A9W6WW38_9STRA|nr:unnamed protein product [Phytophthora lilii]